MCKSLQFEWEPVDQPSATDPIDRATWGAMRIRVGDRRISLLTDRVLKSERETLYLPVFPIAEWLVQNWWFLFHEAVRSDSLQSEFVDEELWRWRQRHCLRAADSSLFLPKLYLFHDGRQLFANWYPDDEGTLAHMPGEFVSSGLEPIDSLLTEDAMARFIGDVLRRVQSIDDERTTRLASQWESLRTADQQERAFCRLAGRMGLDPYDPSEMTDSLAMFLEQKFDDPENPLVVDFSEVARPESLQSLWEWIEDVRHEEQLQTCPPASVSGFRLPDRDGAAPKFGYELARLVREQSSIALDEPIDSVEQVASSVLGRDFRSVQRNHLPGKAVRALVGWKPTGEVVSVGPQVTRAETQRFHVARSLFQALTTSHRSPRLVTNSYSWDQKASRAFAAELLAPQAALCEQVGQESADFETVERFADQYQVSDWVIKRQFENAGIPVAED